MIAIAPQFTQRPYYWTAWKAMQVKKGFTPQWAEDAINYMVWGYDGPDVHFCQIWKGTVPDGVVNDAGYSQAQNDTDKAEFEAGIKISGNQPIQPIVNGFPINRPATTRAGWHYGPRYITWTTAKFPIDAHNMKIDTTTDWGDVTVKFWKLTGTTWVELKRADYTTDALFIAALLAQCTITTMDWHSTFDFDIVGSIFLNGVKPTLPTWGYVIAAPDIPAGSGGSIPFLDGGFPLHLLADYSFIDFHGITVKNVVADPVYKSNKFRLVIDHQTGAQINLAMGFKKFNA